MQQQTSPSVMPSNFPGIGVVAPVQVLKPLNPSEYPADLQAVWHVKDESFTPSLKSLNLPVKTKNSTTSTARPIAAIITVFIDMPCAFLSMVIMFLASSNSQTVRLYRSLQCTGLPSRTWMNHLMDGCRDSYSGLCISARRCLFPASLC